MVRCALLLGVVGACLPATTAIVDGDGDFVDDSIDNCPDVANADQADADGNGVGDACESCRIGVDLDRDGIDDGCDACPRGVNDEDEDADGIADACDLCPAVADPTNADTDQDGVGDACDDDNATPQQRRYFDGFDREIPVWSAAHAWTIANGVATANEDPLRLSPAVRIVIPDDRWRIVTRMTPVVSSTGKGAYAEVRFEDVYGYTACGLENGGSAWLLTITDVAGGNMTRQAGSQSFAGGVPVRLVMQHRPGPSEQGLFSCRAVAEDGTGVGDAITVTAGDALGRRIALRADPGTTVSYVDILAP